MELFILLHINRYQAPVMTILNISAIETMMNSDLDLRGDNLRYCVDPYTNTYIHIYIVYNIMCVVFCRYSYFQWQIWRFSNSYRHSYIESHGCIGAIGDPPLAHDLFEAPICLKKIYSVLGNQGQPWLATKDGNRMRQVRQLAMPRLRLCVANASRRKNGHGLRNTAALSGFNRFNMGNEATWSNQDWISPTTTGKVFA